MWEEDGNFKRRIDNMEIDLETDEVVELVIDGVCEFKVWGERNEEGTMVIKSNQGFKK